MFKTPLLGCALMLASALTFGQTSRTMKPAQPGEVVAGKPEFISYSQAFSLLDGLFQDVSAMQVAALSLSANSANATNLDAVIQQFQANLQFSQTLGIQNATAAQQNAAFSSAVRLESQLISQESQLQNLAFENQQQIQQLQKEADALQNSPNEDAKAAAKQSVANAVANLNLINSQISTIKALRGTLAAPTTFAATNPTPSAVPLPAPVFTPSQPGGKDSFAPSFPASKQMENQVNLLWERLAYLLNTLAQSEAPGRVFLVKFTTSIIGGQGNKKIPLLSTQYSLKCATEDGKPLPADNMPIVLDLFPRMSAVNIADQKYKDTRFGLGALLSFFSVGLNASYNREHLRITQSLGQSAYITGFGIRTDSFGWVFGPTLGEDTPAPGTRTTYALISVPESCSAATVKLEHSVWDKLPNTIVASDKKDSYGNPLYSGTSQIPLEYTKPDLKKPAAGDCSAGDCLSSISYSPVEFEAGNFNPDKVTVDVILKNNLDREQIVSVNGVILKRARDSFARATPGIATGGILQATDTTAGTWFPVTEKELILTLNPAAFQDKFPRILLESPKGTFDFSDQLKNGETVFVSGRQYVCPADKSVSCLSILPALGNVRAASKPIDVARWEQLNPATSKTEYHFMFKLREEARVQPASPTNFPNVQLINDSVAEPWSTQARVTAFLKGSDKAYALKCVSAGGAYLDCVNPHEEKVLNSKSELTFRVFDGSYSGGAIKGDATTKDCLATTCKEPFIYGKDPLPAWNGKDGWNYNLKMINVEDTDTVQLYAAGAPFAFQAKTECNNGINQPCDVDFFLPRKQFGSIGDLMRLTVQRGGVPVGKVSELGFLRTTMSPFIKGDPNGDQTHLVGINLVFPKVRMIDKGKAKDLTYNCALSGTDCTLNAAAFGDDEGYLYFVDDQNNLLQFTLLTDKGLQTMPQHNKPKPTPKPGSTPEKTAATPETPNLEILIKRNLIPRVISNTIN